MITEGGGGRKRAKRKTTAKVPQTYGDVRKRSNAGANGRPVKGEKGGKTWAL